MDAFKSIAVTLFIDAQISPSLANRSFFSGLPCPYDVKLIVFDSLLDVQFLLVYWT